MSDEAIEAWMIRAIRSYGPDYWEHLSITSIDSRFSDRRMWLSGAAECFEAAMRVRDRLTIPVAVRMAIILRPTETRQGLDLISDLSKLESELGETAPVMVMSAGSEPTTPEARARGADTPLLLGGYGVGRYVREGQDPKDGGRYRRVFWIQG